MLVTRAPRDDDWPPALPPQEVLLTEAGPPHPLAPAARTGLSIAAMAASQGMGSAPLKPRFRLAVVCMTKRPIGLEAWLRHHRDHCGAEYFYIRVEDTPELKPLLSSAEWATAVEAEYDGGHERDNGASQTERQMILCRRAISRPLGTLPINSTWVWTDD